MSNDDKLKILGQTATDVPAAATTMVDQIAAAHSTIAEAFTDETHLSEDFDTRANTVETLIRDFISESESEQEQLEQQAQQLVASLEGITEVITEGSTRLTLEFNQLTTEIANVVSTFNAEADRANTSMEALLGVRDEMDDIISVRLPMYNSDFQDLFTKYTSADAAIDAFDATIGEKVDTLETTANKLRSSLETDLSNHEEMTEKKIEAAFEDVTTAYDKAVALVEELRNQELAHNREVFARSIDIVKGIGATVDAWAGTVAELCDASADSRAWAQPKLERLQEDAEGIEALVEKIKDVARNFSMNM